METPVCSIFTNSILCYRNEKMNLRNIWRAQFYTNSYEDENSTVADGSGVVSPAQNQVWMSLIAQLFQNRALRLDI